MTWVLLLPLVAAALHATWNALLKTAADRLVILAFISLVTTVAGLAMLPFVEQPARASWTLIAVSMLLKYAYYVFVYFAYRAGDLSLVYPLARGSAPLLVAAGAALFAGEVLSTPALVGVVIASIGISSLALGNLGKLQGNPLPIALALGTGLMIASYSVVDGIGVRVSESTLGFIAWLCVLEFPVVVLVAWIRRHDVVRAAGVHWRHGLTAGACSVTGYALVLYAVASAPISIVSALRETSVIMAAVIGTLLLGERPWQDRVAASTLVAGGVALMTTFR